MALNANVLSNGWVAADKFTKVLHVLFVDNFFYHSSNINISVVEKVVDDKSPRQCILQGHVSRFQLFWKYTLGKGTVESNVMGYGECKPLHKLPRQELVGCGVCCSDAGRTPLFTCHPKDQLSDVTITIPRRESLFSTLKRVTTTTKTKGSLSPYSHSF